MDSKKQIERQYLDVLRCSVDDFPSGSIQTTERPDFLVGSAKPVLGIEFTRIFGRDHTDSPPPKSQDSERDLVAERAQAIAEDRGISPVLADVYFDSRLTIGKRDRASIAEQLVDLVSDNMPALDEHQSLENRHPMRSKLPPQVEAVSVWRFKSLTSHLWQVGDAGIVTEDFAAHLQQLITDKNAKVSDYRTNCDECWLAIVADWRGPSGFFEISDKMSGESYLTDFDRVYFVEGYSGRVVALNTYTSAT
jgi:hypothetical protein